MSRNTPGAAVFLIALLLACLAPPHALAASQITLSADACFAGMEPVGGVYPIRIDIENKGASTRGIIDVQESAFGASTRVYAYPIDLPTGTIKTLIAYPFCSAYSNGFEITFLGAGHAVQTALQLTGSPGSPSYTPGGGTPAGGAQQVGVIGDQVGALGAVRSGATATNPQPLPFSDCYCLPEAAPDVGVGYSSLSELVVGEGSERLTEAQWDAIKQWVLGGGSLIMVGGAASLRRLQASPVAAELCPETAMAVVRASAIGFPAATGATRFADVALVTGAPKPGTEVTLRSAKYSLLSTMRFGAGTVLLAAFNPFAAPFEYSSSSRSIDAAILADTSQRVSADTLQSWLQGQYRTEFDRSFSPGIATGAPASDVNPFRVNLPPLVTIAGIFGAYFLLVVPVTFFVLRRLRRLGWAWITTPAISVAVAFALYLFSATLYAAAMSHRTAGVITAVAGDPEARFSGLSEMFFPRGGAYAIKIPGAESIEPISLSEYGYSPFGSGDMDTLTTYDTPDGIAAPDFEVRNLAFRRLFHAEPIDLGGCVSAALSLNASNNFTGSITNGTSLILNNVTVYAPVSGQLVNEGTILPGQRITLAGAAGSYSPGTDNSMEPLALFSRSRARTTQVQWTQLLNRRRVRNGRPAKGIYGTGPDTAAPGQSVLIFANAQSSSFGPQIGRDVSGPDTVAVIVSAPLFPQARWK